MDEMDRELINRLQDGIAVTDRPFAEVAQALELTEESVVERLRRLVDDGKLSRFGPLYNAERLGGAVTLVAMAVPEERYEQVAEQVNAHPEVSHNYAREHELNMWFVLSTERPEQIEQTLAAIESETGLPVYNMPREKEYYIGLRFQL